MGKFITGKDLENAVYDIIWDAEEDLLIVSPFIKLDNYFKKELFSKHLNNPELAITIVFGKNENEIKKSLNKEDFDYFKNFPNITIIYVPNLHGKYYGNEHKGVITSINLYDYSFINNIEFGVYSEHTLLSSLKDRFSPNADNDAWEKCWGIAEKGNVVFVRRPVYRNKTFIINLNKEYIESKTLLDETKTIYLGGTGQYKPQKLNDFPLEIDASTTSTIRPDRKETTKEEAQKFKTEVKVLNNNVGYCIRTREPIPFNPNQPLSKEAWKTWSQFSNMDFPEKFCHKTGKPSYGKTSMRKPILE